MLTRYIPNTLKLCKVKCSKNVKYIWVICGQRTSFTVTTAF